MSKQRQPVAPVFAALGDETRLSLVSKLCNGPHSITQLTENTNLTRQAITKHLKVLEGVGLVQNRQKGRENVFELRPEPLDEVRDYLDMVSQKWDKALARLKAFVED
jgi:DNA-binding transcriptional ArsR family regulator